MWSHHLKSTASPGNLKLFKSDRVERGSRNKRTNANTYNREIIGLKMELV